MNINEILVKSCIRLMGTVFPVRKNQVLFTSFNSTKYADNPKAITLALHKKYPDIDIVWAIGDIEKNQVKFPDYVHLIDKQNKYQYYKAISTSAVWVNNFGFPNIHKRKEQFFIQTWHGDKGFKKILLDETSTFVPEQVEGFCDLAIAGSSYGEKMYRSAFGYNGEILKVGTPRNDNLVNSDPKFKVLVKETLNVPKNTKVLLYAPTFRDSDIKNGKEQHICGIDINRTLEVLALETNCEWVCLVRAHPGFMNSLKGVYYNERIINASGYEDMADLLSISDFLITDYSSCAGDFALTHRPLVLFQPDRKKYETQDRSFYFRIEESPFFVAENQEELEKHLRNISKESANKNCNDILLFYDDCESGKASEMVADRIAQRIKNIKKRDHYSQKIKKIN